MATQYEQDEFDALATNDNGVVAHRRVSRKNGWIIALVAVLIISPLLGVGIGYAVSRQAIESPTQVVKEDEKRNTVDMNTDASQTDKSKSVIEVPGVEVEAPKVDYALSVQVLNGGQITGFAAKNAQILQTAGYKKVDADNYRGRQNDPTVSTVYYRDADKADTARDVAKQLQIDSVIEDAGKLPSTYDVVVVLR